MRLATGCCDGYRKTFTSGKRQPSSSVWCRAFVNGLIIAAILSALLLAIPLSEGLSERTRDSAIVNRLAVYAERLEEQLRPMFGDAIARTLNLLTIRPDSNERVTFRLKFRRRGRVRTSRNKCWIW